MSDYGLGGPQPEPSTDRQFLLPPLCSVSSASSDSDTDEEVDSLSTGDKMEWMVMNMDRFFAPAIQLGGYMGEDKYVVAQNAKAKIDEILRRLIQDKARWHFRRSLFMNKIISQNLLPTLIHVKNDKELIEATVKVLQELMTPVECLMPIEIMSRNCEGQRIIHELEAAIHSTKKLFLDTRVTKALIDFMNSILKESKILTMEECEMINHSLLLVRNLLHVHVPSTQAHDDPQSNNNSTTQCGTGEVLTEDQIMWNLFAQRFDNIIIQLLTCSQQHLWNITMVQLVSLMYREQQQGTIRKLIKEWLDTSLPESSEDEENNTMSSSSSDAVSTSDPVSDSSERLSPVDGMTKKEITQGQTNDISLMTQCCKIEKEDSSKDSGFGPLGSMIDVESSQDDSAPEGSKEHKSKSRVSESIDSEGSRCKSSESGVHTDEEMGQDITQTKDVIKSDLNTDQSLDDLVSKGANDELLCKEEAEIEESEVGERENDRCTSGGSEGGSESSSPIPTMEQEPSGVPVEVEEDHPVKGSPNGEDVLLSSIVALKMEQDLVKCESVTGDKLPVIDLGERMEEEVVESTTGPYQENAHISIKSQTILKHPPNEEESGSGDSSVKKSPLPLPKLHKAKPLAGQKRTRHAMSQKKLTDTQETNESSNSTGSECDEGPHAKRHHHQKPHKMLSKPRPAKMLQKALQERNIKRSKLLKRKESNSVKAKALLHHHPTPEDISNLLKEFTIDFMMNGYSNLVQGLRMQVLLPYQIDLDKSHLLWLITYFLRFAVELDLELSQICPVLSVDVVSYLVYEGVVMQEELERAVRAGEQNLVPHVRRLHLVVTALREFFISFELCMKKEQTSLDSRHILKMREELGQLVEVRQLFLLLIRMFRPGIMNLNYLQDLIITNHRFLITQEGLAATAVTSEQHFDIFDHVKQFATLEIMRQYGRLLENFCMNDEKVNDCIFTMMHHVAGDLRAVNVLLQPTVLSTFLRIWKEGFELCVDWADLIEYVLRKCTRVRQEPPNKKDGKDQTKLEYPTIELTNEDLDQLYTLYSASASEQDMMDKIKEICCDDSIEEPIKKEVIQKLLERGFITRSECSKLCAEIPPMEPEQVTNMDRNDQSTLQTEETHLNLEMINKDNENLRLGESKYLLYAQREERFQSHVAMKEDQQEKIEATVQQQDKAPSIERASSEDVMEDETQGSDRDDPWEDNAIITYLMRKLDKEGHKAQVEWLQLQLLELCYAKLKVVGGELPRPEPIPLHFTMCNQSIPLVCWTSEQEVAINSPTFRQLLGHLGFHLPSDTGKIFPRIPNFWSSDVVFLVANRLGKINSSSLKCSLERMSEMLQQMRSMSLTTALPKEPRDSNSEEISGEASGSSSLGCDQSSERVSDCSMENNRSSSATPASSIDERLALHDEVMETANALLRSPTVQPESPSNLRCLGLPD
ncbi:timeless [Oratosquilla oratoria]|uniref:timeless n=1 Tax=Oratosquilla oratoria TaxID=337810 RepID=UPI003F772138